MKPLSHSNGTTVPEVREWSGTIIGNKKEPITPVRIDVSAILAFDLFCKIFFSLKRSIGILGA